MTRALSDNRRTGFDISYGQVKLPDTQTVEDKRRLIERKKATIENMKDLLVSELKESGYNEVYVKKIADTLKPQGQEVKKTAKQKAQAKEEMDTVLRRLVKSTKVSKKANRAAQIILDEQDGIERAKEAIVVFEASAKKTGAVLARMRATQEMLNRKNK